MLKNLVDQKTLGFTIILICLFTALFNVGYSKIANAFSHGPLKEDKKETVEQQDYWDEGKQLWNVEAFKNDDDKSKASQGLEKATIFIAGDSTASIYEAERYPRTGWAQIFENFFYDNIKVDDMAVSGRSSRSFIDEGYFDKMAQKIKKGDYLFIQFGHNDQKNDERHTEPFTTYKGYLIKYIDLARSKGATPVLLTSIHRLKYNSKGKIRDTHGDYLVAVKELGNELDVPVLDMAQKTEDLYNEIGYEKAKKLYMVLEPGEYKNYPDGRDDTTHLTEQGAYTVSYLVTAAIKEAGLPLKNSLKNIEVGSPLKKFLKNTTSSVSQSNYWDESKQLWNVEAFKNDDDKSKASQGLEKATIFVAGDSTASIYEAEKYPRTGWAQVFEDFFYDNIKVDDMAVSGRSSRSFVDEGYFDKMAQKIKKGDYLFIQFGHNDQKNDERYTDPFTTYRGYLTKYIDLARSKGATPVLLTSIQRLGYSTSGKIVDTHGDYLVAVRMLGKKLNVPVLDMAKRTEELYNKLGFEKAKRLYMILEPGEYKNYPNGRDDTTHLTEQGAYTVSYLVTEAIRETDLSLLKNSLKDIKK
jgi:lysophospholipase L1-like esterase